MKQTLRQTVLDKTIPLRELARDFTSKQKKETVNIIKYYDVLVALKKARKDRGFTQQELAVKAHVPRTTITKIESGKHNPTLDTLMTIASAMNKNLQIKVV